MRTKRAALSGGILLCLVAISAFKWLAADPAAVVVQVSGAVQVQKGQGAPRPATVGLSLEAGDKVIIGAGAKAVIVHRSGKMEPVSATTTIAEPPVQQPQGTARQVLTTIAQVASTNARVQPNRQGMIRPVAGEPVLIAPRNEVTVLDVRPTFTWFKAADGAQYVVQVRRLNPAGPPVRFQAGTDTVFHYPASAAPLIPGAQYEWTVGLASGGRIATTQKFRIVSPQQFEQVANTLRELVTAGIDPMTDGAFVSALAYRDAGMFYEAGRLVDQLAKSGTKGRIFFLLRGEILDRLGDLEGAAKAFAAADAEPSTE